MSHSALVAPIALRGVVIGALGIPDEDGVREWTDEEIALIAGQEQGRVRTTGVGQAFRVVGQELSTVTGGQSPAAVEDS